jgi:hypothetical protein
MSSREQTTQPLTKPGVASANEQASETIAAALFLICQTRNPLKVVGKLTGGEFEKILDVVRRWPDHFPPGTLAAVQSRCGSG